MHEIQGPEQRAITFCGYRLQSSQNGGLHFNHDVLVALQRARIAMSAVTIVPLSSSTKKSPSLPDARMSQA